jgi:hypothetical protein
MQLRHIGRRARIVGNGVQHLTLWGEQSVPFFVPSSTKSSLAALGTYELRLDTTVGHYLGCLMADPESPEFRENRDMGFVGKMTGRPKTTAPK